MLYSIRQMLSILDARTRFDFALLLVPMGLITIVEMVSIGLILPVIQVLILGESDGRLTQFIISILPPVEEEMFKIWVIGIFAIFFLGKNLVLLVMIFFVNKKVAYKIAVYQGRIFNAYVSRSLVFHFKTNSSELIRDTTDGVALSMEAIRLSLLVILDGMLMLGALVVLVVVEPFATIGAGLTLCVLGLAYYYTISPIFKRWGEESMRLEGTMIKLVSQSLNGIRDLKVFNAQEYMLKRLENAALRYAKYFSNTMTTAHVPRLLIETVVVIGFLGIVLFLLSSKDSLSETISAIALYGMAALRLMPSLNRLLGSATEIRRRAAYIERVYEAFSPNIYDIKNKGVYNPQSLPFDSRLELRNIHYSYPDANHAALKGVSLKLNKGRSLGFVGLSGAGKSTLMDVVLGLLEPTTGQTLSDGQDIFSNISSWQENIGFVSQQVFIMDDTIRRNVAFGVEDADIEDEEVLAALEVSRLKEFVVNLPEGLGTKLGEHGTRLSGGQRQRIAIARALYRDPEILVFDEATSALDNTTEKEISSAIDELRGQKTILVVAHRISTVANCDQIVLMEDGAIVAVGGYKELLTNSEDFRKLASLEAVSETKGNP